MNSPDKLPTDLPANLPDWPLQLVTDRFSAEHHGDFTRWQAAIDRLPKTDMVRLTAGDTVHIDFSTDSNVVSNSDGDMVDALSELRPWRKGPFQIGPVTIDTEWRSDWKWRRLAPHIELSQHRVLDIGCGNGYFGWRMLNAGAQEVVGIDPTLLFCMQHRAVQHFLKHPHHWVLPLKIEEIPRQPLFDTVLSMGVIYHRKDPADHVRHLSTLLNDRGQVILESIVSEESSGFKPTDRYARMRNVWWIPTVDELSQWLADAGFTDIQCVDLSTTSLEEQRSTDWMPFESLKECLDPSNAQNTIEGYPRPKRAVMLAQMLRKKQKR
ncbi:MAG: tRNA (mo5U34)-methyltransferase [Limisphaerales bacterium]|jgi:tRNA (mo5U34)-methyltransferase